MPCNAIWQCNRLRLIPAGTTVNKQQRDLLHASPHHQVAWLSDIECLPDGALLQERHAPDRAYHGSHDRSQKWI